MTNPIGSLPATPETVGVPRGGEVMRCIPCDYYEVIRRDMIDDDGVVMCRWCGSYDVERVWT